MEKMIIELTDGMHLSGQYLIGSVAKCVNNNGQAYLNLDLKDSSGSINAKKWEVNGNDEDIFVSGNVLYVEGEVLKYKDSLQVKILSARKVESEDVDIAKFMKAPPVPKE